jgi:hypothetical protein
MITIEDIRRPKIFNMAIFDLVATFIGAFIVHLIMWIYPLYSPESQKSQKMSFRTPIQYIISLLFIFLTFVGIGVIAHRIFNVQSALSKYLGFYV